jgi:diadenosine tetraphosphate (Ap4A) HIT family hydrolase
VSILALYLCYNVARNVRNLRNRFHASRWSGGGSLDVKANTMDCTFCQRDDISHIFKETPNFLLAADHAPLVEGHLLIISKHHYACYGDVPAELDAELYILKHEVQQFFTRFYAPAVFWEHGIFRQTVFHAHMHCFPWGATGYDFSEGLHNVIVDSQEDVRQWYLSRGHYFYMEDRSAALLFAPETDRYLGIVKNVFRRGIASRGGRAEWRTPQQRYEEGRPLIAAVMEKWLSFQQQGADYVNEPGAR